MSSGVPEFTVTTTFTGAVGTIGWHAVAWSISAGGAVRYVIDNGAVQAPAGTPLYTARGADPVQIGRDPSYGIPSTIPVAYIAILPGVVADADLQALTATPSQGYPTLGAIVPSWAWPAAAYAGAQRVTIGGTTYAMTGAPQVWVP